MWIWNQYLLKLKMVIKKKKSQDICYWVGGGTGKSTVTQAMTYKWAKRELWDDKFDLVFHLECRHLNPEKSTTKNLATLLMKHHDQDFIKIKKIENDLLSFIITNQKRVLLIIDGLDELNGWEDAVKCPQKERVIIRDMSEESSIPFLLLSLITRDVLGDSYVFVTSRPTQAVKMSWFSSVFVALGFNEEAIDSCTFAVCDYNRDCHRKVLSYICDRTVLHSHCVVPLNCVFLSSLLYKKIANQSEGSVGIDSLSQMYIWFILDIIHKDTEVENRFTDMTEDHVSSLRALAELAADSMLQGESKIIFDNED